MVAFDENLAHQQKSLEKSLACFEKSCIIVDVPKR